jgi:hypothetical protein
LTLAVAFARVALDISPAAFAFVFAVIPNRFSGEGSAVRLDAYRYLSLDVLTFRFNTICRGI